MEHNTSSRTGYMTAKQLLSVCQVIGRLTLGIWFMKKDKCIQVGTLQGGDGYTNFEANNRIYSADGLSPSIITRYNSDHATGFKVQERENMERIRKLTPRECWRLQGFSDEAFDKAKAVNSDSQLYKQAGNSITVDVLVAILGKLLTDLEENK